MARYQRIKRARDKEQRHLLLQLSQWLSLEKPWVVVTNFCVTVELGVHSEGYRGKKSGSLTLGNNGNPSSVWLSARLSSCDELPRNPSPNPGI